MWTAWFLKEREPDLDVVLLEADICGGGRAPERRLLRRLVGHIGDMITTYGEPTRWSAHDVRALPRRDRHWCEAHGVDAWFTQGGDLAVATSPSAEGRWRARSRQLGGSASRTSTRPHARGGPGAVRLRRSAADAHRRRRERPAGRLARGSGACSSRRRPDLRGTPVHGSRRQTGDRRNTLGAVRAGEAVIGLGAWATWWKRFKPCSRSAARTWWSPRPLPRGSRR